MKDLSDRSLTEHQYRTTGNLDARIRLHQEYSTNPYGWQRWVFDRLLAGPAHGTVVEVGCGTAALWSENRARIPAGWQIVLTDRSESMLAGAHRNLGDLPWTALQADAQAIPLPSGCANVLIANHMLYHVPDRPRAMAEFQRVLARGGRLYAATNGPDHLRELRAENLIRRFGLPAELLLDQPMLGGAGPTGFDLANGGAQLGRWFSDVRLEHYEDSLLVTQPAALAGYLLSMSTLDETGAAQLHAAIAAHMVRNGPVKIMKSTGLFMATRQ